MALVKGVENNTEVVMDVNVSGGLTGVQSYLAGIFSLSLESFLEYLYVDAAI